MVDLQLHQPEWSEAFRVEAASIGEVLADEVDAVEHIGSTAIPGLIAKPIIDLAARTTASADPSPLPRYRSGRIPWGARSVAESIRPGQMPLRWW
ncbi:MAG TPA: GrpB family protein [Plantibacter sp.]|uniref:GrpB family protein n=1 Tax=unclassified Plantibacter TaxID=2624265 RepID=UPI002B9F04E0|nr:GrpB family protein [Plantibacter sp.]